MNPFIRSGALVLRHLIPLWICASAASANTVFSAYFNNGTGSSGDKTAAVYNWQAGIGTTGTVVSSPASRVGVSQGATNTAGVPLVSGQSTSAGFLFALPAAAPGAMLLYRTDLSSSSVFQDAPQGNWFRDGSDSLSGLTVEDIDELSVYTRPASAAIVMRFAIRVDNVWRVSTTAFQHSGAASLANYENFTLNPSSENWYQNVFSPNVSLDDDLSDNASSALPASGVISGYGWYADTGALSGTNARVRIDSYQISLPITDPYLIWIGGFPGLTGPDADRDADPDGDGITNVFEFITGSLPDENSSVFPPSVVQPGGGNIEFTYRQTDDSLPLAPYFELSETLDSWQTAVDGENGVTIITDELDATTDLVRVIVSSATPARFGRIGVVNP